MSGANLFEHKKTVSHFTIQKAMVINGPFIMLSNSVWKNNSFNRHHYYCASEEKEEENYDSSPTATISFITISKNLANFYINIINCSTVDDHLKEEDKLNG